ncbi:rRNA maturation RNase YbeY [Peterkaempfera bronchialis]|uniref:Endoribonuclease YbeY n=1 Tax=Peterkaempfera bronchialis TaxID=2126346 RepID=A0A345SUU6_9ACTN|nr:rRNA maturation RNase YbeY [Peterkaempfera bronchialis]AXI77501.1 rRNA maturation RNase YbeY [Peterkaempfera bronchialis]
MSIDVNNESGWEVDEQSVLDVARYALDRMRIHPLSELSVILVDADAMEQLHIQWMDEPGPTDVMSFPMDELRPGKEGEELPQGLLGDIVLCPEVALKQGGTAGHSMDEELQLLTVHGVLHVLGYDHEEPEEEREMFGLQKRILDDWRAARGLEGPSPAPTTR